MQLFTYLSLTLLRSLFKSLKTNVKASTRYTCTTDLDLAYLLTQSQFWQLTSEARAQDKTKQYYCCFFFLILFSYAIQGKFITWLENSVLNCTWKPISHSSLRDLCDIGFRVQFNAEFPCQVMNFPIIFTVHFICKEIQSLLRKIYPETYAANAMVIRLSNVCLHVFCLNINTMLSITFKHSE